MGCQKLLLPWGNARVVDRVLSVWTRSRVDEVLIVVRNDDRELREACADWPVRVVIPEVDPPDMKASIQSALETLKEDAPDERDHCLIAPADLPTLSVDLIDSLIEATRDEDRILVPRFGGRQGHPIVVPWAMHARIASLAENEGLNTLVDQCGPRMIDFPASLRPTDIDTPQEYEQLRVEADESTS